MNETPTDSADESEESVWTAPEYDLALKRGSASFEQLVEVFFLRSDDEEIVRRGGERYFEPMHQAFENAHGGVVAATYAGTQCAVALTDRPELHIVLEQTDDAAFPQISEVVRSAEVISIDAVEQLRSEERRPVLENVYALVAAAFDLLDDLVEKRTSKKPRSDQFVAERLQLLHGQELAVRSYFGQAAQRAAQFRYLEGMVLGFLTVSAVSGLITAAGVLLSQIDDTSAGTLAGTVFSGGLGALVSVLSRMTNRDLVLDARAGRQMLRVLGAFRPAIGGSFAFALFALLQAGALPFIRSAPGADPMYLYLGLGFIAGFSERWAQDMLSRTRSGIGISGEGEPSATGVVREKHSSNLQ
jgi:hypothetical protein